MNHTWVWIFNGSGSRFPSAVFNDLLQAEEWIAKHNLSGILTKYPVGISVYEWATKNKLFVPNNERHQSPDFIQSFTSASQEHYHYEDGRQD